MGVEYGKMHPTCQGQTKPWKERNSMENAQIVEEKAKKTPIGMFGVVLPPKALDTIASRKLSLYIEQRLNWVEDGLMKLIDLALSDSCKLSDYLRLVYPNHIPIEKRKNDTGGERKPLKFRFRYMLRSLEVISRHYKDLVQWRFSGLEFTLGSFCEIARQVFGPEIGQQAKNFYEHFRSIWQAVNPNIWSETDLCKELKSLVDEVDALFDAMLAKSIELEAQRSMMAEATTALKECADDSRRAAKDNAKSARIVAKVAGLSAARVAADEDSTSMMAGLDKFNPSQRREIEVAIRTSHCSYPLTKGGTQTISSLAERCWRNNIEDFEALAMLPDDPGFRDVKSYKTALYRLHKKYPAANHFCWKS